MAGGWRFLEYGYRGRGLVEWQVGSIDGRNLRVCIGRIVDPPRRLGVVMESRLIAGTIGHLWQQTHRNPLW